MLRHGGHSASVRLGHTHERTEPVGAPILPPQPPPARGSNGERPASRTNHRCRARRDRRRASPFAPGSRVSPGAVASRAAETLALYSTHESSSAEAGRKARERFVDGEQRRGGEVFGGDPLREGNLDRPVGTRSRVHLIDGGKALERKSIRDTHKGWPDPPVEQGDLPIDQARRDDVGGVEDASEHGEDLMAGRVSPPATADRLTDDLFCQIRQRPASGLQHHPLLAHPVQRIHEPDSNTRPGLGDSCICAGSSKRVGAERRWTRTYAPRDSCDSPNGLPSESLQIAHAFPGWTTLPPSASTRSRASVRSLTAK